MPSFQRTFALLSQLDTQRWLARSRWLQGHVAPCEEQRLQPPRLLGKRRLVSLTNQPVAIPIPVCRIRESARIEKPGRPCACHCISFRDYTP